MMCVSHLEEETSVFLCHFLFEVASNKIHQKVYRTPRSESNSRANDRSNSRSPSPDNHVTPLQCEHLFWEDNIFDYSTDNDRAQRGFGGLAHDAHVRQHVYPQQSGDDTRESRGGARHFTHERSRHGTGHGSGADRAAGEIGHALRYQLACC